ncbi:MAG: lipid A deacylase LpxR family protein [SAR324 cluster bacterium]|nr:lipid A deacylase LpxR family protein [SAR324 cluster bacterium]
MKYFLFLLLLISTFPFAVYADRSHHQLYYENDFLNFRCFDPSRDFGFSSPITCSNEDAWYTSGILYEGRFQSDAESSNRQFGFSLGQMIFTPENIKTPEIVKEDRPYAGWLYGSYFLETISSFSSEKIELVIGILGEFSKAKEAQTFSHDVFYGGNKKEAQGWAHQIGSELGIVTVYERKSQFFRNSNANFDLNGLVRGRAGNIFIDGSLGAITRLGVINPLPPLFDPFHVQNAFFLALSGEVKVVGYDATFQGGGFDRLLNNGEGSPRRFEYQDLRPLVGTVKTELVVQSRHGLLLSYMVVLRSKEFVRQSADLRFGRVTLSINF